VTPPAPIRSARRLRPPLRRALEMAAGILLMIFAPIVGGPILPGPFGFIGFAMGLALLLRNSRRARKRYIRLKRRFPRFAHWIDLALRRRKGPAAQTLDDDRQQRQHDKAGNRQQHLRLQQ
jgi:UPF0716 family protein affecting phage T7 exclusion